MLGIFHHEGSLLSLNKPSDWYKSDVEVTILEISFRRNLSKQATIVLIHSIRATLRWKERYTS